MNPLLLYLLGSVAGIALMVGVNVALFGRRTGALDLAALQARLALDNPGFRSGEAVVAGRTALVENAADGALYLARASGDTFVTRKLSRGSVKRITRSGASLDLRFADFTFPRARLAFANEDDAGAWHARIAGR
jgi:hypothetical protein